TVEVRTGVEVDRGICGGNEQLEGRARELETARLRARSDLQRAALDVHRRGRGVVEAEEATHVVAHGAAALDERPLVVEGAYLEIVVALDNESAPGQVVEDRALEAGEGPRGAAGVRGNARVVEHARVYQLPKVVLKADAPVGVGGPRTEHGTARPDQQAV